MTNCFVCLLDSGFEKDPKTSKFEIYAKVDQLSLIGQYKVKGNVIILPVVGNGPANLTFSKLMNNSFLNYLRFIFEFN